MQSSVSSGSGGGDVRGGGRGGWGEGCIYVNFFRGSNLGFLVGFPRLETRCRIFEIREIPKMGQNVRNVCLSVY